LRLLAWLLLHFNRQPPDSPTQVSKRAHRVAWRPSLRGSINCGDDGDNFARPTKETGNIAARKFNQTTHSTTTCACDIHRCQSGVCSPNPQSPGGAWLARWLNLRRCRRGVRWHGLSTALNQLVKFTTVQPYPSARGTVVNLDTLALGHDERDFGALGTFHFYSSRIGEIILSCGATFTTDRANLLAATMPRFRI